MNINITRIKKLIVLTITIIALAYIWGYFVKYRPWDIRVSVKKNIAGPEMSFHKINIKEISGEVVFFDISAQSASFYKTKTELKQITGNILTKNKPVFFLKSDLADINFRNNKSTLQNFYGESLQETIVKERIRKNSRRYRKVKKYLPSWKIKSSFAKWNHKYKALTIYKPLKIWRGDTSLSADKITYYSFYQLFVFDSNFSFKNEKYTLNSDKAQLKEKLKTLTCQENATFKGADFHGRAEEIDFNYEDKTYTFRKNVLYEYEDTIINTDLAETSAKENLLTFTGNVKLLYKNILIQSDKAILNRDLKIIEFEDNIKAWRDKSLIEGQKMIFDIKEKKFVSTGGRTKFIKNK